MFKLHHPRRFDKFHEIQQLDPVTDHQRIVYLVGAYEYPWLLRKSLEFALFRTYGVPYTSRILKATGEFTQRGQKRYDDTTLLLAAITEQGYDSEFGQAAIGIMNELHGRWKIKNEEFLYVLSTFVFEPIRWHRKYGWRQPTERENLANFYFWREVGRRMNIQDLPDSIEAFEQFNIAYEREHFRYDDANRAIGEATLRVFLDWYPAPLRPIVREFLLAFMDDPLLNAMGFRKPHAVVRWLGHIGLKAMGLGMRFMPPRQQPYHLSEQANRTYPGGHDVRHIGAHQPAAGD